MKEGWTYKKLGEVCEIFGRIGFRGYTKGDLVSNPDEGAITLSPSNIVNGEMVFNKCSYIKWAKYEESPEIMIYPGDILLVKTASVGKTALVKFLPHKATINPQFVVLKNILICNEFLSYYLKSKTAQDFILSIAKGAAAQTVSQKNLAEMHIPVPPLSEQHAIVARLDSAFVQIDSLKANAEKQLSEARQLFQKALEEAMTPKEGWEEKTFGEVCSYHKEQGQFHDLRYIGMENMESGTGRILGFINSNEVLSSSFKFNKGEVLYGRLRPYLKKVYIAEFDGCCSTEVFPIKSKYIEAGFIKYWLLSEEITNKINATSAGCRMPRGNMNEVKKFPFYYPLQKFEQHSIVAHLDTLSSHVRALEEKLKKMKDECDALKQAMLREVFE